MVYIWKIWWRENGKYKEGLGKNGSLDKVVFCVVLGSLIDIEVFLMFCLGFDLGV